MKLNQEQMEELVYAAQGTCYSLNEHCQSLFGVDLFGEVENEMEVCDFVDQRIFECSVCGWWCESGDWIEQEDTSNGEICSSCGEDQ